MRILDLFCGAGGASIGFSHAGISDITGLDIEDQKEYPFEFLQMDAFDVPLDYLREIVYTLMPKRESKKEEQPK